MIPVVGHATSGASGSTAQGNTQSAGGVLGSSSPSEQTFLQLLVAQLKNQDPEQPQDGTQFVAELAEFSSLEQEIGMRQDLDNMNTLLNGQSPATPQGSHGGSSQT